MGALNTSLAREIPNSSGRYGGMKVLQRVNTATNSHDGGAMMMVDIIFKFLRSKNARQVLRDLHEKYKDSWISVAKRLWDKLL